MSARPLPSLEQVDPAKAWLAWQPSETDPWNLKWAGHLYRRAAFGVKPADLEQAVGEEFPVTLNRVLHGQPSDSDREEFLARMGEQIARQNNLDQLRGWWLYAIQHTMHPLREKMTLFWHNHFATSIAKVKRTVLMYKQNQLLRRHALGKFRPLLLDISHDPAMLVWLDSNSNVKGSPNENYARELMELFSLGVGHYTEKDVREAARAFTGWHTEDDDFDFSAANHDPGVKTVLGRTGAWNGDDIVGIVLEQPAAAQFLVRKLYRYFISETANPPARLLEPLVNQFRKNDYDTADMVSTILSSRHFFSPYAFRQRVKNPVEFTMSATQALVEMALPLAALAGQVGMMGQELFAPPNVKGWAGGRSWLNTATVLARHNFAEKLAMGTWPNEGQALPAGAPPAADAGKKPQEPPEPALDRDAAACILRDKLTQPGPIVDRLIDVLLQGDIHPASRSKLIAFLADGKPAGRAQHQRIREIIHTVMTMPEYQLA